MNNIEATRAQSFIDALETMMRAAIREGGKNATLHVGDLLRLIEAHQSGALNLDGEAPAITGPFYPPSVQ